MSGFPISGPSDRAPVCGDCRTPVRKIELTTVYGLAVFALTCHGLTQRVTKAPDAPWHDAQPVAVPPPPPSAISRLRKRLRGNQ